MTISIAPRFGKLDTTPIRTSEITRSQIFLADQMADQFEQMAQSDELLSTLMNDADKAGLDVVMSADCWQNQAGDGQFILGIQLGILNRKTGKPPKVSYITGTGKSDVTSENSDAVLREISNEFKRILPVVTQQFSV